MKSTKFLLILSILSVPVAGWADPVGPYVVVAPSNVFWVEDNQGFLLTGNGFNLQAASYGGVPIVAAGGCLGTNIYGSPIPCQTGDVVDMSAHTPGVVQFASGPATYGGVTYSNVDYTGQFTFTATPMAFPGGTGDPIILQEPFVFSGQLLATSGAHPLFSVNLTGTGTTERPFWLDAADNTYRYQLEGTSYRFNTAPVSATPEPASLLMLGTGLAGLAARRRRSAR